MAQHLDEKHDNPARRAEQRCGSQRRRGSDISREGEGCSSGGPSLPTAEGCVTARVSEHSDHGD
jgi:hypothetical protein